MHAIVKCFKNSTLIIFKNSKKEKFIKIYQKFTKKIKKLRFLSEKKSIETPAG
jgi:hypothetical protein